MLIHKNKIVVSTKWVKLNLDTELRDEFEDCLLDHIESLPEDLEVKPTLVTRYAFDMGTNVFHKELADFIKEHGIIGEFKQKHKGVFVTYVE